ncbi:DNA polymerase delta subunit 4 [Taphrina deformans PYCC 5710]|uniref:DNA polymerase delta subunit 4 n=1 Tax=Taphrina deformans (strain PYCC 5710 / ATCC 11124 / CBS 356.35 / IMI 108563 / JCM 9778 / NBRC 8474) TaxID=1097556 RepID=R4XE36_TAPDE|nr:DNA polymerase delta subunit 4 [Taphrina deformans PYCC 5710]|eukprot:CCG81598.1 DNA polymerase delta subunit 4 [Taphrina deformans PYCC 5710]
MPAKSKAPKRLGSTSSFNSFRVSKSVPKAILKNVKAPVTRQESSDDVKISLDTSSSLDSSEQAQLTEVDAKSPPEVEELKVVLPQLDENDEEIVRAADLIRSAKKTPALHTRPTNVETILRDFDLTGKYGPCVGISRLDRYNRAVAMKMNPPVEVGKILNTQQAQEQAEYKHDLFYGRL